MLLNQGQLNKDIIKLLVYFDLFDYPLTSWELWQLLPIKCNYQVVQETLERSNDWQSLYGFYYLPKRQTIIATRQRRYNIADQKFKKAKRITWLLTWLPWIKMICLANIIGQHNLKTQGDIDLFIITKKNRLWLTRLFAVGLLKLLRLRPTAKKSANTICLSFMIDDDDLNLEKMLLNQSTDNKDLYFTYWLAGLQPIYNKNKVYEELISNNHWLKNYLPNWQPAQPNRRRYLPTKNNNLYQIIVEKLLGWSEPFMKKFQYKVMNDNIKQQMNQSTNVIVNDHVLKLHITDNRHKYYQLYINNLQTHV